ncbi:MAG: TetR/AcrR family transcriptional regulator [Chloroflexota bacterium]
MTPTHSNRFSERERQILDATLELVATEGLLKTSISKISKRAKSSPGIVYHYFESKDEIMDTLFLDITMEMMAYILDDLVLDRPVLERYKDLWLRKYHYHFNNPAKTIFIEEYKNSSFYTKEQAQESQRMMLGLLSMGQKDIEQGLVVNLPLDVIYTMTFTVALNLAKSHIQGNFRMDENTLDMIAERVCRSALI